MNEQYTLPQYAGRVLGSQIYVSDSLEGILHDVPFSLRDIFINTTNGNIYQFNGVEWVYCYTIGAGTLGNVVRATTTEEEALAFDVNTLVVLTPSGSVPRLTRVASDSYGAKTLETVGLGDGSLPYITNAVADLLNYYNKSEVDAKIAAIHTIEFLVVDELPITGQSNIIYLVPHTHGVSDLYDEYCWVASESKFEKIGNTDALVNYYNKDETDALLATKQNALTFDSEPTAGSQNPVTSDGIKTAIDAAASRVYRYKGSLPYYANLPVSGNVTGDVYNIENADPSHGVKAGDNVAWNGLAWDVLAGVVDLTDYYTKAEVDAAVAPKANSADVYTKLEENALLAEKADKATTYTKTETDALLAPKANSADVNADLATKADKATTYTKTETDALLAPKATTADVNAGLALKADKATTYTKTENDALLAGKADKSTTYTKTEVDAIAAGKADANNVYTKAQSDALLANKANGSDVYTKAEVGNLLAPKANSADVYSKSETYSEEQVDAIAAGKVDKVSGKQLSTEDYTSAEKAKLQGIEAGAQVNDITSVAGKTGDVTLTKSDVGLGNVENTSDAQKPVSTAQQAALDLKANKSETYTKTEVGDLLSPKANRSELGTAASKNVGTASGNVPIIGADGKLDPTVMPAIVMSDTYVVTSQADMLALNARVGDVAIRTDENKTYILKETGASTLSHWQELLVPTADILNMLIEPFLTTEAYNKGDYVTYSNVLYRFTADKSAGSWDSTKVETATLNDLIDDVNAAVESVNNKLTKGDYDGTTGVGYADVASSLQTEVGNDDETPFAYQTAGGESDLETGMQSLKKLVGVSVVKNQQFDAANSGKANVTYSNGLFTITNYGSAFARNTRNLIQGHKYLVGVKYHIVPISGIYTLALVLDGQLVYPEGSQTQETNKTYYSIVTKDDNFSQTIIGFDVYVGENTDLTGSTFQDIVFVDLTQRYGSNDVISAIIGNDANSQINRLLRFDPSILKDLSHDTGTLVSSKSAKLKNVSYNLWDEVAGYGKKFNTTTGQLINDDDDRLYSVNPIRIPPNATIYCKMPSGKYMYCFFYDANDNYISGGYEKSNNTIVAPANACFMRFHTYNYRTTYQGDICPFLYWDGSRIGYEPYEEHEYDLPNKTLHGVLKVVDGKVVADGDELYPNRMGKTRYGSYTFTGNEPCFTRTVPAGDGYNFSNIVSANNWKNDTLNAIIEGPVSNFTHDVYSYTGIELVESNASLYITFPASMGIDTVEKAKAYMAGKTIVYELATPTDLTDQPAFAENIYVDDFGTMEFLDENDQQIAGLQGVEVFYKANIAGHAESLYVRTDGDPSQVVIKSELDAVDDKHDALYAIMQENVGGALRHQLVDKSSIDFANTDYVDLGDLTWSLSGGESGKPYAIFADAKVPASSSTKANIICGCYKTVPASDIYNANKQICLEINGRIYVYDTSATDATSFKAAMKGILLAHEKASS